MNEANSSQLIQLARSLQYKTLLAKTCTQAASRKRALSSSDSASSFLGRAFSFSNFFRRFACSIGKPPYSNKWSLQTLEISCFFSNHFLLVPLAVAKTKSNWLLAGDGGAAGNLLETVFSSHELILHLYSTQKLDPREYQR